MTTNAPIEIDTTTFTADYEVTERLERPNTSRPFFVIPEGGKSYGPDYLVAVKRNDGSAWIGQARCGDEPKLLRGIWATPGPAHARFANGGYVYLVDTRDPIQAISLPGRAYVLALAVPTAGALLFVETNHITAVGAGRILWNRKVSNDGVRIVNVRDGTIEGVAWQYPDEEVGFTIDAATGRVEGGTPYD